MIHYKFSINNPSQQYIQIELSFTSSQASEKIQLPSWRPGRYELGNFAKNVKNFEVKGDGSKLCFQKITKDCWEIVTNGAKEIVVS